jgi:hypothetical protein
MEKAIECKVLGKPVVITCTPAGLLAKEVREWERHSAGLILKYECSGRSECQRHLGSPWCPFTSEDAKALRLEWLNRR